MIPRRILTFPQYVLCALSKSLVTNDSIEKELQNCTTVDDYKKNVTKYAEDTGLERFFPKDSDFVKKLAEGLVAFKNSNSPLNTPENMQGLVQLSMYQTILFCGEFNFPIGTKELFNDTPKMTVDP